MRISNRLQQCKQQGKKALSFFITAGYPTLDSTVPLVLGLAESGADIVEIGIPFSDPIADGSTIQMSSEQALRNGITLAKTFIMAKEIRKQTNIPLVLMGYANPIFAFGLQEFIQTASEYGVDGIIVPDLPLE
ncbi:MAG TPA: tryptophan synthase subunit alpha, partial [Bacteroidota bacterium]|nr:tryptophan synthase subunit alpha [Bacteroidota bacterium]